MPVSDGSFSLGVGEYQTTSPTEEGDDEGRGRCPGHTILPTREGARPHWRLVLSTMLTIGRERRDRDRPNTLQLSEIREKIMIMACGVVHQSATAPSSPTGSFIIAYRVVH